MHYRRWGMAGVMVLTMTAVAQAGVYSTLEPNWPLSDQAFSKFQNNSLIPLRRWGTEFASEDTQRLSDLATTTLKLAKDLSAKGKVDPLSANERMNLAAFLIRTRRPDAAILMLKPAALRDGDNFLVASMMGSAYLQQGEYDRAVGMLADGLVSWRKPFAELSLARKKDLLEVWKWNEHQFGWYGRCEKAQRRLAFLRRLELKSGPLGFSKALERLDALFPEDAKAGDPPLRFVGESGKFEPGKMAAAERAKLPKDAISVVQQLLIWMPEDQRLYWLLGELLNADDQVSSAKDIFEELFQKFTQTPEVQFGDAKTLFPIFLQRFPEVGQHLKALREYEPPAIPIPPPLGNKPAEEAPKPNPEVGPAVSFQVDWQTLAVGFGAGGIVGFMISWRLRNLLLGRQRKRIAV